MNILVIISGTYGARHLQNICDHGPASWSIASWQAPAVLPPVIDYPEDYLPDTFTPADLILSFGEHRGIAELLPDIAIMSGARAVIAPVDNEAWLPRGLARQLRGWLEERGITCATPKPLCSLNERDYLVARRQRISYQSPLISEFARFFGEPQFHLTIDPETKVIVSAEVGRDAVCGCARFVAAGLVGVHVNEAEEKAGLLHHHYPCLAAMGKDSDFGDTLMHISGNILKENISGQVKPYKQIQYIAPGVRSDDLNQKMD
mgnify:CR=1 FL=1